MTAIAEIQLSLLQPDVLDPLPIDAGHYVAVLQNKSGERAALQHVSRGSWERLTPLVEIVPKRGFGPILSASSVKGWVTGLWDAVGKHPFYLDILRPEPAHKVEAGKGSNPVLVRVYAEARNRGMRFVPVLWVGKSSVKHTQFVADAVLQDGHGVALRYRVLKVMPAAGKTHSEILQGHLDAVGVGVTNADLLVDLEYLDPDSEIQADDLVDLLGEMYAVGDWRCVVLLGTSVPRGLGGVNGIPEGMVGTIPRREWALWTALTTRTDLSRLPAFGDYAVQHPLPPADDIPGGGGQVRANIRYTTETDTVIARGRGPVSQEGREQYGGLCQRITARSEFTGAAYSWGDAVISDCANGVSEPGTQGMWRAAGTSHHLEVVTDQVRDLEQARTDV